jgi:hypothetical protein
LYRHLACIGIARRDQWRHRERLVRATAAKIELSGKEAVSLASGLFLRDAIRLIIYQSIRNGGDQGMIQGQHHKLPDGWYVTNGPANWVFLNSYRPD